MTFPCKECGLLKSRSTAKWPELEIAFKNEVHDRAREIDPEQERDWFNITMGWCIAKGEPPAGAYAFACHIRYHTDLG